MSESNSYGSNGASGNILPYTSQTLSPAGPAPTPTGGPPLSNTAKSFFETLLGPGWRTPASPSGNPQETQNLLGGLHDWLVHPQAQPVPNPRTVTDSVFPNSGAPPPANPSAPATQQANPFTGGMSDLLRGLRPSRYAPSGAGAFNPGTTSASQPSPYFGATGT